jgi:putative two-component system response regulator
MSGAGGGTSQSPAKKTVLVVDDDPDIRAIVRRALSPMYTVREAADGLLAAAAVAVPPTPDLVILDVTMPNADGLTFAATLKADPKFKTVPVIFLTARTTPQDIIHGIQVGARAYMTKPFKLEELRQRVVKVLG